MKEIVGGGKGNKSVIYGIGIGCFAAGVAGVASTIFTFGAGAVFGLTLAGAFLLEPEEEL
jgi:hypothetical protein